MSVCRYNTKSGFILGLSAFLPQILALLVVSWKFGRDLPMAFFLLTFIFVTFNKVCTAQVSRVDLVLIVKFLDESNQSMVVFCLVYLHRAFNCALLKAVSGPISHDYSRLVWNGGSYSDLSTF